MDLVFTSLAMLCYCRWEALLVVLDNRPFPELHSIIRELEDDRIWVFAEWVGAWGEAITTTGC